MSLYNYKRGMIGMKKFCLLLFSFVLFLTGVNYSNALVEGDDVYHLNFTADRLTYISILGTSLTGWL